MTWRMKGAEINRSHWNQNEGTRRGKRKLERWRTQAISGASPSVREFRFHSVGGRYM